MASTATGAPDKIRTEVRVLSFHSAPTIQRFLNDWGYEGQYVQGPFGSAKTLGGLTKLVLHGNAMACRPLPPRLQEAFGRPAGLDSRYVVVRREFERLRKTTLNTFLRWFADRGKWVTDAKTFHLTVPNGRTCEILWMGLDTQKDVEKVLSLELTGYLIDEACEAQEDVWMGLQGRKRRFPEIPEKALYPELLSDAPALAVSNPPDDEHWLVREFETLCRPTYRQYTQPGGFSRQAENLPNLQAGYYQNLFELYAARPDLQQRYVMGERAVLVKGGPVYQHQWNREALTTNEPQTRPETAKLLRGWDASGNVPAALVGWLNPDGCWVFQKEFVTDRAGIKDFAAELVAWCQLEHPNAEAVDVGDPATFAEFSAPDGGLTSNAKILKDSFGIKLLKGVQSFRIRRDALGERMSRRNGMRIYAPGCPRFVSGLAGGYAYPMLSDGRGYGDEPIKNQYSHVVEAGQYAATWVTQGAPKREERRPAPYVATSWMG